MPHYLDAKKQRPKGQFPPAFIAYVEAEYRRLGARVFQKGVSGILVEKLEE